MKIFSIAATILFCFGFYAFSQEIIIKGKINNPIKKTAELTFPTRAGGYETISLNLDSINHTFEYKSILKNVTYVDFHHVSYINNTCSDCLLNELIIEPGDEVNMTFDTKNFWASLTFEGKSSGKFNYYKEDFLETRIKGDWEQKLKQHAGKPAKEYFMYIDQAIANKLAILKKYQNKISPTFYKIREADIKAIFGKQRLSVLYDPASQDFKPIQSLPYEIQTALFKNLPQQNDTTVKARHFFSYITGLSYTYLSEFHQLTQKSDLLTPISIVRQNQIYFHPAFAEELSGQTIVRNLTKHGLTSAYQENITEFEVLYPDSPILQEIEQLASAKKDFTIGKPAMPFKVPDVNSKEINLQDFQGKVIYLDFWASWCVPCLVDIEQSKKVKEHFKNRDDIIFLYISLDTNEEKWKTAIDKYSIKGTHGIAYDNNPILKDYGLAEIPSYFIIGKDGNFHTIQPIRPSINEGKGLIKILERALSVNSNK